MGESLRVRASSRRMRRLAEGTPFRGFGYLPYPQRQGVDPVFFWWREGREKACGFGASSRRMRRLAEGTPLEGGYFPVSKIFCFFVVPPLTNARVFCIISANEKRRCPPWRTKPEIFPSEVGRPLADRRHHTSLCCRRRVGVCARHLRAGRSSERSPFGQRAPSCRQRRGHLADDPREERAVRQTREAALVFALSHHRGGQFPVLFLFYGQIAAVSYGGGGLGAVRAVLRGRGRL